MPTKVKRFEVLRSWRRVPLILLLLAAVMFLARSVAWPQKAISAADLAPLSLDGVQRILIMAPHCDDETLGPGGLIQSALRAGIQVRVVIATNGDGYLFATAEEFRKLYPTARDYIRMGEVRQQESLAALAVLGLAPGNVFFLSYPDRGTPSLWEKNWSEATPYKSPYSGASRSPYKRTYNPNSVYAGEDYLADLISIFDAYRPDLVVYPHPGDVHPDHWGLSVFTRLALTEVSHSDADYRPRQITYLVHRPDYPIPRRLEPNAALTPPPALYDTYPDWLRWDLTRAQEATKQQAVQAYKSQLPLLRGLMESFVRTNELFAPVVSLNLPEAATGEPEDPSSWQNAEGQPIPPVQLDPRGDVFSHRAAPSTDLTAVYAARTPAGDLWMCARLSGRAVTNVTYALRLKALTEDDVLLYTARTRPQARQSGITRHGVYFCAQTTLADLDQPWAIFLGATVESPDSNVPFDQTAWKVLYVQP